MAIANLTEEQKAQVRKWLEQGLQLAEIQSRLESEFGIRTTYMDVKLLVSDLQVLPKDPEPLDRQNNKKTAQAAPGKGAQEGKNSAGEQDKAGRGRVSVSMDEISKPGAVVSGSVTFSDGKRANWYVDEYGRLGIAPAERGYRPTEADMREFQVALEQELARHGF
ncbi:MAG: hypothetical protein QHJ82_12895 [Verrucomicrobiota bacterium]|nr:hypothetical protein [Verrucomicrobiota bacterium]